ncbi:hypothetical protein KCU75_g24, partial [Aureobasidium melanogenum]
MQINTASGMLSTESLCVVTTDSDEKQSSNGQHAITRTIVHLNSIGEGIRCSLGSTEITIQELETQNQFHLLAFCSQVEVLLFGALLASFL